MWSSHPNSRRNSSSSSANLGAVQMPPEEYRLVRQGRAQVLTKIQGVGGAVMAGSRVLEGEVSQGSFVRISRNRRALWTGRIRQLRLGGGGDRAVAGQECAVAFAGFKDFEAGDAVEAFQLEPIK
jgi:translation initiation factor IF-2